MLVKYVYVRDEFWLFFSSDIVCYMSPHISLSMERLEN